MYSHVTQCNALANLKQSCFHCYSIRSSILQRYGWKLLTLCDLIVLLVTFKYIYFAVYLCIYCSGYNTSLHCVSLEIINSVHGMMGKIPIYKPAAESI